MDTTLQACIDAFSPLIQQQNAAIYLLMGLGLVVALSGLVAFFLKRLDWAPSMLTLILGAGLLAVTVTGSFPWVSGSVTELSLEQREIKTTYIAGCYERAGAVTVDAPEPSTRASASRSASPRALAPSAETPTHVAARVPSADVSEIKALSDPSSFAWVFYREARAAEADKLSDILQTGGVLNSKAESDLARVAQPQASGVTRVMYSDKAFEGLAKAIAGTMQASGFGKVVIDGPLDYISRKPIQIQMF